MPPALPGFARREAGRVAFRDGPTPLALSFDRLRSADGHDVSVYVRLAVRPVDRPADVQSFAEQFLTGREAVSGDDVREHFSGGLAATAAEHVARQDAAAILDPAGDFDKALRRRAEAVAFGCGLEVVQPWAVTLDSPSLRAERDQQSARHRQLEEAEHAAKLAGTLSAVGPAYRLPADEQSALLPTLLAARRPADALLTAGPNLVVIEPDGTLRVVAAGPEAGPLRCVRALADGTLAVGGTAGVVLLDSSLATVRTLTGSGTSGRGYNAVARLGATGEVVAAHGEIGLCVWPDAGPPRVLATPGPARSVVSVRDHVWFAAGSVACAFDGEVVRPLLDGPAAIVALLPLGDSVVVVRRDGTLQSLDAATGRSTGDARADGDVAAAAVLDAGGLRAAVLADERGRIHAVTTDGRRLARLAAGSGGVRMLAVVGPDVVAVTADRASVVVQGIGTAEPPRTINVLARTGHHVTDLIERPTAAA